MTMQSVLGQRPRRMLADISWKETSGVDHPANEEEGWLIMKNGTLAPELQTIEKLLNQELTVIKQDERLLALLQAFQDKEGLPANAKSAARALIQHLKAEGVEASEHEYGEYGKPKRKQDDEDEKEDEEEMRRGASKARREDEYGEYGKPKSRKRLLQALMDAVRQTFTRQAEDEKEEEDEKEDEEEKRKRGEDYGRYGKPKRKSAKARKQDEDEDEEEDEEMEQAKKALNLAWPSFTKEISEILGSSADKSTKKAKIAQAIETLAEKAKTAA